MIKVSIIVAMYNIADTIEETLQSIQKQTYKHWEAILIDDGSSDGTLDIVNQYLQEEPRFRLIHQTHSGVSQARNRGIEEARHEWILFLDGDDWIFPKHLKLMTSVLARDSQFGAVYCGWCWYSPDGYYFYKNIGKQRGDLFPLHAVECPFAIHAYIIKTEILREVGGFDPALSTCEDWDLWQRISRTGVLFGRVPKVLAPARMRAGSASMDGNRILEDGLKVLVQGHRSDHRLKDQHPHYTTGLSDVDIEQKKFYLLCSAAGLLIGRGEDPKSLLDMVEEQEWQNWDPLSIAECITLAAMLSASRPLKDWTEVWSQMKDMTLDFLFKLEKHCHAPGMAGQVNVYPRILVGIFIGATGGVNRILSAGYKLVSFYRHFKHWYKINIWPIKYYIKMFISASLMMDGRLYRWARQLYRRIYPSEDGTFFEDLFEQSEDPWEYTSAYEQKKYGQALELIPGIEIKSAIELACAEGHFTVQLAPRVKNLLAADISENAIKRCAQRCSAHNNIKFEQIDLLNDPIDGSYQLMVCSEVLYFTGTRKRLRKVALKMVNTLQSGGYLIMAHGNVVIDEPTQTGFNWEHSFGAKGIGETFAFLPNMALLKEIQTPLYRVQLFQKTNVVKETITTAPEIIRMAQPTELEPIVSSQVLWNGCTEDFPILLYHSISPDGSQALADYRVSPENFEAQLRYLRDEGFVSINVTDCINWINESTPLPAGAVLITFDDGYTDFKKHAWPLLKEYGFSAHVFIVSGEVGKTNRWDKAYGEVKTLMSWDDIQVLEEEGVSFGAHTHTHPTLTTLSLRNIYKQMVDSQIILGQNLDKRITSMAYPYGEFNKRVMYMSRFCEYKLAFTCEPSRCTNQHSPLAIPRFEIGGNDTIDDFSARISGESV